MSGAASPAPWTARKNTPDGAAGTWTIEDAAGAPVAVVFSGPAAAANASAVAAAPDLLAALDELQAVFALPGEDSFYRFERLASMFHKDTGYLAPGKSAPMYSTQPDGDELRVIYDGWYAAKVERARAAIAKATGK